ncbi:MAG: DNA/RNA non-specific endonuclease [Chloroflexales bacterium]
MRLPSKNQMISWILPLLVGLIALIIYTTNSQKPTSAPAQPTSAPAQSTQSRPSAIATANGLPSATAEPATAKINRNLRLGNPSTAVHDPAQPDNYLIERPQYVLSYNRDHGTPNWVSWQITENDLGDVQRSNVFKSDATLPKDKEWYHVKTDDYTGSGYDRGHMCPSADRSAVQDDNDATFILTNILPQAPNNNRGTWEQLESDSRSWVRKGHVLYVIAGGDGESGTIADGKILVPGHTWKVIVVMPKGESDITKITAETPVIAVRIPNNLNEKLGDWKTYQVTVADIEAVTGYHFFTNLSSEIQQSLKTKKDPVPTT